jgi:periplasmic divalent cation tolerance protein
MADGRNAGARGQRGQEELSRQRLRYRGEMMNDAFGTVVAWTTWPEGADVTRFARALVEERLAACVTTYAPVRSVYRWRGAIEEDAEQLVMIKTTGNRIPRLRKRVRELHPAEVPELIVVPVVDGDPAYLAWVAESTGA